MAQAQDVTSNATGTDSPLSLTSCDSWIYNAITTPISTIGNGISALDQLIRVKDVFSNVDKEFAKLGDLLKECSSLATQHRKCRNEIKSYIGTVKKEAQVYTKTIEIAKQQMLKGNKIPDCLANIQESVKKSKIGSKNLEKKYYVITENMSNVWSKAKAAKYRIEFKADFAKQGPWLEEQNIFLQHTHYSLRRILDAINWKKACT